MNCKIGYEADIIEIDRTFYNTTRYKKIFIAVIIKISKKGRPAPIGSRYTANQSYVTKADPISIITLETIPGELILKAITDNFLFVHILIFIASISFQVLFIRRKHIYGNYIQLAIVIIICDIVTHTKPAIMAKMLSPAFSKTAVAIIQIIIIVFV